MDNYEAIRCMSREQMGTFLDNVLLTGFNLAMYANTLEDDSKAQLAALDANPYDIDWLLENAEDATRLVFSDDDDIYLPKALRDAILKATGIEPENEYPSQQIMIQSAK